jgi:hypothetical protein
MVAAYRDKKSCRCLVPFFVRAGACWSETTSSRFRRPRVVQLEVVIGAVEVLPSLPRTISRWAFRCLARRCKNSTPQSPLAPGAASKRNFCERAIQHIVAEIAGHRYLFLRVVLAVMSGAS